METEKTGVQGEAPWCGPVKMSEKWPGWLRFLAFIVLIAGFSTPFILGSLPYYMRLSGRLELILSISSIISGLVLHALLASVRHALVYLRSINLAQHRLQVTNEEELSEASAS